MAVNAERYTRRYELDWLRVFAIAAVFVYHSAHFFNVDDWSVKNATTAISTDELLPAPSRVPDGPAVHTRLKVMIAREKIT